MTQAPRRRQVDRRRETQAQLIGAATELLRSVGYAGTTTALIAKQAGVTTGALHHHFASKDDLMLSVLDRSSARVLAQMEQQEHRTADGGIDVKSLIAHLWEIYRDPDYWAIWEIIIGSRAEPALHRRVAEHRRMSMQDVLHPWVRQHMAAGRPEPEILALFEFMLVAIRGLSLERFLDKDEAYFARNLDLLADLAGRKLAALPTRTN